MNRTPGVFPNLIDERAFLDKLVISISAAKSGSPPCEGILSNRINRATGGEHSNYSRVERGVVVWTGNSYELRYAPIRLQKIIPSMVLVLRSDRTPVTVEEMAGVAQALCKEGWQGKVSQVELTRDLSDRWSVEWFRRRIFGSARRFLTLRDELGRLTHYVGGRTTPLQLRIYEKVPGITRFEFILQRPFLKKNGINTLFDLEQLRDVDLASLVWLHEPNERKVKLLGASIENEVHRRILEHRYRNYVLREFVGITKKWLGVNPADLVLPSSINSLLRSMQSRLVLHSTETSSAAAMEITT